VTRTVHRRFGKAMCHYCNHSVAIPEKCASCGATYLDYVGVGTERVEAEIRTLLPAARVARVDRDTVSRRGAIGRLLHQFRTGDLDVLVGTQMIAKGHDFPRVTLVGVISADVGLGMADFRAAERTFQLLTQVAGRAGRGVQSGQAIIQTLYPGHYAVQHAQQQDFTAFFRQESAFRRTMKYPPWRWLINVIVRGTTQRDAMRDANGLTEDLRRRSGDYQILGPAPAPLQRLRGEYRVQFLMKTSKRQAAHRDLRAVLGSRPDLKKRVVVDVDPVSVL
jgi:primosomal protein N' (replication factor Y) (superfamily II helicase)